MTDYFAPPTRTFEPLAPPRDGLIGAFADARRRRQRKAAASGTAGVLASVVLLSMLGGSAPQVLVQQPAPPASNGVVDVTTAPGHPATAARSSVGAAGKAGAAHRGTTAAVTGPAGVAMAPAASGAAAGSLRARPMSAPMSTQTYSQASAVPMPDPACPVTRQEQGEPGLCGQAFTTTNSNGTLRLGLEICNLGPSDSTLSFATTKETDLAIQQNNKVLWRWSRDRAFTSAQHAWSIAVDNCIDWTTNWSGIDQGGHRLAAGTYDLVATSYASEMGNLSTVTTTVTVS